MSDFSDALDNATAGEARDLATRANAKASALQSQLTRQAKEVNRVQSLLDAHLAIPAPDPAPAWIAKPERLSPGIKRDTPVLMLSDLHLDELVDLEEMSGLNAYDDVIAERRLGNVVDGFVELTKDYTAGVHHDGVVCTLLGDNITGEIHDELARTNVRPPAASLVWWAPKVAAALLHLADEFGHVFVPVCDGNHDRFYVKTPHKQRAESSLAWVFYHQVQALCAHDDRITFSITKSPEQRFDLYGTKFLITHGDDFQSAGGVGGIYPSLLKWVLRAHDLYSTHSDDFHYVLMGHWHQAKFGEDFIINGSLKGYDEYARRHKFKFQEPGQVLFTVTPEHGMGWRNVVWAD